MKILAAADLHMTTARPENRLDNYEESVLRKFDQILGLARKHDAVLTISGDLWDTSKLSKIPYQLTNKIIQMIRLSQVRVLACHGQHDMAYHNPNLQTSPYYTLFVGGAVEIPGALGIVIDNVRFYGSGWGQDIPMPGLGGDVEKNPDIVDVLLLHRTITPGEPPFFLKDATPAEDVLKTLYNFDFILSGDYHEPFIAHGEKGILVNCGPMMRQGIDKRDYRPRVYLIDTETLKVEPLFLDVESNVWNDDRLEKQKRNEVSISTRDLLNAMNEESTKPDFIEILDLILEGVGEQSLVNLVQEVIITARKRKEGLK